MKYIRAIDENLNDILLSTDLKKEYKIESVRKWGSKNIRESIKIAILGLLAGLWILGNYFNMPSYLNALIGAVVGFLLSYFVIPHYKRKIEEVLI